MAHRRERPIRGYGDHGRGPFGRLEYDAHIPRVNPLKANSELNTRRERRCLVISRRTICARAARGLQPQHFFSNISNDTAHASNTQRWENPIDSDMAVRDLDSGSHAGVFGRRLQFPRGNWRTSGKRTRSRTPAPAARSPRTPRDTDPNRAARDSRLI